MTAKRKIQILVDFSMTLLLPILMAYSLLGELAHEWLGIAMFALLVLHHGLNWNWHKNLFHGRYSAVRLLGTAIDLLIFALMLAAMISGIVMSRHVFSFLPFSQGAATARLVHLAASYWCYALTSVHLGLHGTMLMGMLRKAFHAEETSKRRKAGMRLLAALVAGYGLYAFIKRDFGTYMLMQTHFAFYNFSEPVIFFLLDYLAIMALFAIAGYYIALLMRPRNRKQRNNTRLSNLNNGGPA